MAARAAKPRTSSRRQESSTDWDTDSSVGTKTSQASVGTRNVTPAKSSTAAGKRVATPARLQVLLQVQQQSPLFQTPIHRLPRQESWKAAHLFLLLANLAWQANVSVNMRTQQKKKAEEEARRRNTEGYKSGRGAVADRRRQKLRQRRLILRWKRFENAWKRWRQKRRPCRLP